MSTREHLPFLETDLSRKASRATDRLRRCTIAKRIDLSPPNDPQEGNAAAEEFSIDVNDMAQEMATDVGMIDGWVLSDCSDEIRHDLSRAVAEAAMSDAGYMLRDVLARALRSAAADVVEWKWICDREDC